MKTRLSALVGVSLAAALFLGAALIPKKGVAKAPFTFEPNQQIITPTISNNGRWLAVLSRATNLIEGGNDGDQDVFLIDTKKGDIIQVSRTFEGGDPELPCSRPAINPSGRFVVYDSSSPDIVPDDDASSLDVFLFDRKKQTTALVSTDDGTTTRGGIAGAVSKNGRWVAFVSETNNLAPGDFNNDRDVFVRDMKKGELHIVSLTSAGEFADGDSNDVRLSANGRFVIFSSIAALVPEDDNGLLDVYHFDLKKSTLTLVSTNAQGVISDGASGNGQLDISDNGRWVTFSSGAQNLLDNTTAFANVFRKDMKKNVLELVNRDENGTPSSGIASTHAISPDGRFVVFGSLGTDLGPLDENLLRDLYMKDMKKGTVTRISQGFQDGVDVDEPSEFPSVSKKAKFIAFQSLASTLIEGDVDDVQSDVFVMRR